MDNENKCRKLLDACSANCFCGELFCNACYRCICDNEDRAQYICCDSQEPFPCCVNISTCGSSKGYTAPPNCPPSNNSSQQSCCKMPCMDPQASSNEPCPRQTCCKPKGCPDPCDPCCSPLPCKPCCDPCCACCRKVDWCCPETENFCLRKTCPPKKCVPQKICDEKPCPTACCRPCGPCPTPCPVEPKKPQLPSKYIDFCCPRAPGSACAPPPPREMANYYSRNHQRPVKGQCKGSCYCPEDCCCAHKGMYGRLACVQACDANAIVDCCNPNCPKNKMRSGKNYTNPNPKICLPPPPCRAVCCEPFYPPRPKSVGKTGCMPKPPCCSSQSSQSCCCSNQQDNCPPSPRCFPPSQTQRLAGGCCPPPKTQSSQQGCCCPPPKNQNSSQQACNCPPPKTQNQQACSCPSPPTQNQNNNQGCPPCCPNKPGRLVKSFSNQPISPPENCCQSTPYCPLCKCSPPNRSNGFSQNTSNQGRGGKNCSSQKKQDCCPKFQPPPKSSTNCDPCGPDCCPPECCPDGCTLIKVVDPKDPDGCPPCCPPYCPPPRKPICYPPTNCCENDPCAVPTERICYFPQPVNKYCSCGDLNPCDCCLKNCQKPCEICCRRCGRKVYAAEKILISGGAFHSCCFSCYCCHKSLEITNYYENQGEIYCKTCYSRFFGLQGYGYGSVLRSVE